jgi:hypothetical protein
MAPIVCTFGTLNIKAHPEARALKCRLLEGEE